MFKVNMLFFFALPTQFFCYLIHLFQQSFSRNLRDKHSQTHIPTNESY